MKGREHIYNCKTGKTTSKEIEFTEYFAPVGKSVRQALLDKGILTEQDLIE